MSDAEEPLDISKDQHIKTYPGETFDILIFRHSESSRVTKVRYFVRPTDKVPPTDPRIRELEESAPKLKIEGRDAYLTSEENLENPHIVNALNKIRNEYRIPVPCSEAEILTALTTYLPQQKPLKSFASKDILHVELMRLPSTTHNVDLVVSTEASKSMLKVTPKFFLFPKDNNTKGYIERKLHSETPSDNLYPILTTLSEPLTQTVLHHALRDVGNYFEMHFDPDAAVKIHRKLDAYRQDWKDARVAKQANVAKQHAKETDFHKPVEIGTYTSADKQYQLVVQLHEANKKKWVPNDGLPYLIKYYLKVVDGPNYQTALDALEKAYKTSVGGISFNRAADLHYFDSHTVREDDIKTTSDQIILKLREKLHIDFTHTIEQNIPQGGRVKINAAIEITNFCHHYLDEDFGSALSKMPPKSGPQR